MAEVFADTAGWASAFVRSEQHHKQAVELLTQWQSESRPVVTTNLVLTELSALLTSPLRVVRSQQVAILETIRQSSWVEVVHVDIAFDNAAFELFRSRQDKLWSLVDCATFVVMQQRKILEALTTDQHFEQAGFLRLLK